MRKEQGQRLKEYSEKKRQDKLAENEERLTRYRELQALFRSDAASATETLAEEGLGDEDELTAAAIDLEDQVPLATLFTYGSSDSIYRSNE